MKKNLITLSFAFTLLLMIASCSNKPEYETVAQKYTEAVLAGDFATAKTYCIPEAGQLLDFASGLYAAQPKLKELNKKATCKVIKSELKDKVTAKVTIEEYNTYDANPMSNEEPKLVAKKQQVIDVVKQNDKWLVQIKK